MPGLRVGVLGGLGGLDSKEKAMYVETILRKKGRNVVTVQPDDTVGRVARILYENAIGAAPVRDAAGDILGMISERDIIRGTARHQSHCTVMLARELMTSPIITCDPHTSIDTLMEMMTNQRIRHLPVVEDGELLGLVSIGDIVKQRISEIEHESDALRRYIATG
jgi:CBS domain-containing protein